MTVVSTVVMWAASHSSYILSQLVAGTSGILNMGLSVSNQSFPHRVEQARCIKRKFYWVI